MFDEHGEENHLDGWIHSFISRARPPRQKQKDPEQNLVPTFLDNEVISRAERRNIQNKSSIRERVFACFHCGSAFGWPQESPRRASFSAPPSSLCVFLVGGSGVQKIPFPLSTSYT
jgi:hypothetical protein